MICKLTVIVIFISIHEELSQETAKEARLQARLAKNELKAEAKASVAAANLAKVQEINSILLDGTLTAKEKAAGRKAAVKTAAAAIKNARQLAAAQQKLTALNVKQSILQIKFPELVASEGGNSEDEYGGEETTIAYDEYEAATGAAMES